LFEFFAETLDKLLCVYNAFRVNLIDVSAKHGLERAPEGVLWELEVFVRPQKFLHLLNRHATLVVLVGLFQHVEQAQLLEVKLSEEDGAQELHIGNAFRRFELFCQVLELAGHNQHLCGFQTLVKNFAGKEVSFLRVAHLARFLKFCEISGSYAL